MNGLKNMLMKHLKILLVIGWIFKKDGNNTLAGLKCGKCQKVFVFHIYLTLCLS